jgi:ribonuclease E
MSKEIYISSTPHETRLAIVEDEALTEIYYERENEYTLAGSIYNGRVTRVLPGMQSSFVDIGLERDAFLYITDFMEEVPDPEEFDTASNGDRTRAPRPNGGDRTDDSAVRADAAGRETTGRGPDRGDRGGRGRRGGRDRNSERTPDRGPSERGDMARPAEPVFEAAPAPPREIADVSEIGEGAPGADGGRRWRGRRGRRRGRGASGQPVENEVVTPGAVPASSDAPAYSEEVASPESEAYIEIDASAPERPSALVETPYREGGRRDEGRNGPRRDGQRSDSRRDQGGRPDQHPNQRSARGFSSSRDTHGVDANQSGTTGPIADAYPDADFEAAPEPLILPGESLSKYRKDEHASATPGQTASHTSAPSASITLAPPASLYTIADGWDGGATLPGETLSRRRSEGQVQSRSNSRRDSEREPRREGRPDRNARLENRGDNRSDFRNSPAAAELPPRVAAHHATAAEHLIAEEPTNIAASVPPLEAVQEFEAPIFGETATHPEAAATSEAAAVEAPEPRATETALPAPQPAAEYEPSEASASHRVDPLPRSEYRQSAPVLEPPTLQPPAEEIVEPIEPEVAPLAQTAPAAETVSAAEIGPVNETAALAEASPAAPVHDVTSISAGGEMYSEPVEVLPDTTAHPAPMEVAEPASPIRHEGAVSSGDSEEFAPLAGGFAPSSGQLAEEVLDEEYTEGSTLHASSIEEMDDLEGETLEGAADLGTMLREMSIDHITRAMPEVEEEDDSEEDDLEEDELDEEDDLDSEEEDEDGARYELGSGEAAQSDSGSEEDRSEQQARAGNPEDAEFFEQQFGQHTEENRSEQEASAANPQRDPSRERESDRRGGRRDGRRGQRGDRDRGDRNRGGRNGHSSGGHGRASMQSTNLPAISDLLKPGQEILVQIAKEPIAKKGARITSHIALPGRFLVFMPTVNHTGVSRKIESDGERRRLKEILLSEKGDASGGFIVRTAAEGASEEELRSDLRFLLNLWADIKARSDSSKSPALIYHDLNLIERILRDQVTDNFSAIWVDSEAEYERVLRFLQRFQPSLIRRVKLYSKDTPLFEQFGITEEINKALRSKVWLKSGGSIVINQTEALVAIDINTGKFVGKTARLEDTIVKTNLDAIPEIVRQIRLRDLGGIIIIDFIDMDERKNRNRVMAALEEELKSDRAPSKVLQFNDFGLVAITRKRVKQSLERTLSTTCSVCTGTGMVKSPITVCNDIYIEMRKMHKHLDRGDVMLRVHPEVVKQLKASGAKWLQEMEEMAGKTILVKSDPALHPEQFDIH